MLKIIIQYRLLSRFIFEKQEKLCTINFWPMKSKREGESERNREKQTERVRERRER